MLYCDQNSIQEKGQLRTERSGGPSPGGLGRRTKLLFAELCGVDSCIDLFCDNRSAICLTKDQMFHERTNHIDVKYHYVRDVISQGKLKVCKSSTHDNPADMMTKPVPVAKA